MDEKKRILLFLYSGRLVARTPAFQVGEAGSKPVRSTKFCSDATVVRASWNEKTKSLSVQMGSHSYKLINATVTQLDRVPGYELGSREFESLRSHQERFDNNSIV